MDLPPAACGGEDETFSGVQNLEVETKEGGAKLGDQKTITKPLGRRHHPQVDGDG